MKINLSQKNDPEELMMRDAYCNTLIDLAGSDPRIVALDADLMKSMGMAAFLDAFPDRTFNCGVQEANMIGIAAGLSATGKIPYVHSFGTFASRRCFDQIFLSAAYAGLNIRITGSDPGIAAAYNGGTHMAFEDVAIMRSVPEMTIIEPADSVVLTDLIRQLNDPYGVFYMRLYRRNAVKIYQEGSTFAIGKAVTLREGGDLTIIAAGLMVPEALKASEILAARGIESRVIDMFTIKPPDVETIIRCAEETGAIITAENHNIIGGLGSAVAEVIAENHPVPMARIGRRDQFGEVGSLEYLREKFAMGAGHIAAMAEQILSL